VRQDFREKASGARPDRRELLKLLKDLTPGDVMAVTRIDRIARSTFDLFAIVKQIVDAGGQFRSLAEPWATRHRHRALKSGADCTAAGALPGAAPVHHDGAVRRPSSGTGL
jgi:hypothetical protein